jgi:hypothetical protein
MNDLFITIASQNLILPSPKVRVILPAEGIVLLRKA